MTASDTRQLPRRCHRCCQNGVLPRKHVGQLCALCRSRGCTKEQRAQSEAPLVRKHNETLVINIGDTSDDESSTNPQQAWDVEQLFAFDVDELVRVARNAACGWLPKGPLGSPQDECVKAPPAGASQVSNFTQQERCNDSSESDRLRQECAFKDKQIERLRRVVCELLCWGAAHWPHSAGAPAENQKNRKVRRGGLRASAPEFVALGILPMPESQLKMTSRRAVSAAPGMWRFPTHMEQPNGSESFEAGVVLETGVTKFSGACGRPCDDSVVVDHVHRVRPGIHGLSNSPELLSKSGYGPPHQHSDLPETPPRAAIRGTSREPPSTLKRPRSRIQISEAPVSPPPASHRESQGHAVLDPEAWPSLAETGVHPRKSGRSRGPPLERGHRGRSGTRERVGSLQEV